MKKLDKKLALKKTMNLIGNIIFACLLVIMLGLVFYTVKSKIEGGVPTVAGQKLYVVLTGSMSPTFNAGSIVAVKPLKPEEIKKGDIITFKEPGNAKTIITHRVRDISRQNGNLMFTTRGDANDAADPEPVPAGNIIGTVTFSVPYAGYLTDFAKSKKGLLIMMVIPGLVIIGFELKSLFKHVAEAEKEEQERKAAAKTGEAKAKS